MFLMPTQVLRNSLKHIRVKLCKKKRIQQKLIISEFSEWDGPLKTTNIQEPPHASSKGRRIGAEVRRHRGNHRHFGYFVCAVVLSDLTTSGCEPQ